MNFINNHPDSLLAYFVTAFVSSFPDSVDGANDFTISELFDISSSLGSKTNKD